MYFSCEMLGEFVIFYCEGLGDEGLDKCGEIFFTKNKLVQAEC